MTMAGRRPLSWLLAPVHVAAVATGAKSFCDNPVIGSPRLNRAGLHIARIRLAQRMTEWRRERLGALVGDADRSAFRRDGFIVKRDFLPAADYRALKQQVVALAAPARRQIQGDAMTRRIPLDNKVLASLPALRAVVESPQWLGLLRYVGSSRLEPLVYIQTIFAQALPARRDPQTDLHADTFHSSVKAWLFLTDVSAEQGAFVYVPGSHRMTRRRLAWERRASLSAAQSPDPESAHGSLRITPAAVRRLGFDEPRVFAVPQNTLIVADTLGFHARGMSAGPSARLEIWAYGRRNPFLPWLGLDPAALPLVKGRAVPLHWSILDALERLRLGRNPWRPEGVSTALATPDLAIGQG